eukprot:GHVN01059502.1.p1 GENE.GHVN01059502.1~~GHVN01059502.1.p1  ORF type:complete len:326 (+),score=20.37 GHVN01059502.1:50-1027(+)
MRFALALVLGVWACNILEGRGWKFGNLGPEDFSCGKDQTCYQVLYVTPKAEAAEIKRSYRRLALELHPDKSSDPQAPRKFALIAKAYEILSDPEKREAYDYYLLHPERFLAMYYGLQAVYPAPTNPFVVLLLILFVGHLGQFFNARWRYENTITTVRDSRDFLKKVEECIAEEFGNRFRKLSLEEQEAARHRIEEAVIAEHVVINGEKLRKFHYTDFAIVKMSNWPVKFWNYLVFTVRWFIRFNINGEDYTEVEHTYLTRKALNLSQANWEHLTDDERSYHLSLELWVPENLSKFIKEQESKERANAKKRLRKKGRDTGAMMEMD